ncbi:hypothetical protein GOV07_05195 [Candidatus Woesearchaeota archaeon]|nr:hypothetical protein [Candidatus Woesearchaeota archaeon]
MESYRVAGPGWEDTGTYHRTDKHLLFKQDNNQWYDVSLAAERQGLYHGQERLEKRLLDTLNESTGYRTYERLFTPSVHNVDLLERSVRRESERLTATIESSPPVERTPAYLAMTIPDKAYAGEDTYILADRRTGEHVPKRTLKAYAKLARKEQRTLFEQESLDVFNKHVILQGRKRIGIRERLGKAIDNLLGRKREVLEPDIGTQAIEHYNQAIKRYGGAKHLIYESGARTLGLSDGEAYQQLLINHLNQDTTPQLARFDRNLVGMSQQDFTNYVRDAYEGSEMTLAQLAAAVSADTGMKVSTSTLSRIARQAINEEREANGEDKVCTRREAKQAHQDRKAAQKAKRQGEKYEQEAL